jgi:cell division septum initiation protein DivIVA
MKKVRFCFERGSLHLVEKELRKLNRRDLVDVIYQLKKNEQNLQEEIDSLQEALKDKRLKISNAGSIADAASSITNVFGAAQQTADLYLSEICFMKEEAEKECAKIIEEAEKKALEIISNAENKAAEIKSSYEAELQSHKMKIEKSQPKNTKKKKKR